jgi:hypothetical protein
MAALSRDFVACRKAIGTQQNHESDIRARTSPRDLSTGV